MHSPCVITETLHTGGWGCLQSFLPLPLPTEPHGHLAKCHHRHHKVASSQGASPRALGLASGLSTWVGSASRSWPSCAHARTCPCPRWPQKGEAWARVVLHHLLRDGCAESSYEVNQEAHNNPPVWTTRGPKASLCQAGKRGAVPNVLGKPSQRFALCGERKGTVRSQHPREQRSRDPCVLDGSGGGVSQQSLCTGGGCFPDSRPCALDGTGP